MKNLHRTEVLTSYDSQNSDCLISVNNGAGVAVIAMPQQPSLNKVIIVKRKDDTSTGIVSLLSKVSGVNIQNIDTGSFNGFQNIASWGTHGQSYTLVFNGVNWEVIN